MKFVFTTFVGIALFAATGFVIPDRPIGNKNKKVEIQHRIQLCTYTEYVPVKEVEMMRELGGVSSWTDGDKKFYLTAPFKNENKAAKELPKIQEMGFVQASQVVQVGEDLMDITTFHDAYDFKEPQLIEDVEEPGIIRIWK